MRGSTSDTIREGESALSVRVRSRCSGVASEVYRPIGREDHVESSEMRVVSIAVPLQNARGDLRRMVPRCRRLTLRAQLPSCARGIVPRDLVGHAIFDACRVAVCDDHLGDGVL